MAKKILVVDDNRETTRLVEGLLTSNGYEVISLNFPKSVLKVIKQENPSLVLLDIIMPYKDGYKVCEEIKTAFGEKVPVILFTSQPYEKDFIQQAFKDFGADDYLIKPFNPEELLEKIKKFVPS